MTADALPARLPAADAADAGDAADVAHTGHRALIGRGRVRHHRLRPRVHAFEHPTWFLLLPMRRLRAQPEPLLRRNLAGWVSFHDADHGDGGPDALAWLDGLLAAHGITDADGEAWLHTYPRMFGFAFKPVSFWYCHRADGSLAAIVAEVNNTFGGRHCYVLSGPELAWGRELQADKRLHVSPFCTVSGGYRFRFLRTAGEAGGRPRTVVRIEHDDAQGLLLRTSVSGELSPLTAGSLRRALAGMPLLALGVVLRIHWQALRLMLKGVRFHGRQPPPADAPPRTAPGTPAVAAVQPDPS